MQQNQSGSVGIGFLGLLTIVFIALKLTGHIAWSWWLVLLPLYGLPLVFIAFGLLTLIVTGIALVCGGTIKITNKK